MESMRSTCLIQSSRLTVNVKRPFETNIDIAQIDMLETIMFVAVLLSLSTSRLALTDSRRLSLSHQINVCVSSVITLLHPSLLRTLVL